MPNAPELTDAYVLCQDCGHAELFTDARHFGDEYCPNCGGDFCGCNACSGIARLSIQFQALADAEKVRGRAPGSSEQLHRSDERKHGRSEPLTLYGKEKP